MPRSGESDVRCRGTMGSRAVALVLFGLVAGCSAEPDPRPGPMPPGQTDGPRATGGSGRDASSTGGAGGAGGSGGGVGGTAGSGGAGGGAGSGASGANGGNGGSGGDAAGSGRQGGRLGPGARLPGEVQAHAPG